MHHNLRLIQTIFPNKNTILSWLFTIKNIKTGISELKTMTTSAHKCFYCQ